MELIQPVIAIVDDDASLRRALSRLMHASGWKTVVFASAEAFVQTGLQESPDCLVLDIWLPGMTGLELLDHVVATTPSLPVIIITGRDDVQVRQRAAQSKAVAYFEKPVDEQDLLQTIRHALGLEASKPQSPR